MRMTTGDLILHDQRHYLEILMGLTACFSLRLSGFTTCGLGQNRFPEKHSSGGQNNWNIADWGVRQHSLTNLILFLSCISSVVPVFCWLTCLVFACSGLLPSLPRVKQSPHPQPGWVSLWQQQQLSPFVVVVVVCTESWPWSHLHSGMIWWSIDAVLEIKLGGPGVLIITLVLNVCWFPRLK